METELCFIFEYSVKVRLYKDCIEPRVIMFENHMKDISIQKSFKFEWNYRMEQFLGQYRRFISVHLTACAVRQFLIN